MSLQLRDPPALQPREGAGGMALNAIPMLGGLGSIVLLSRMGSGPLRYVAMGLFLFAIAGLVLVQVQRQRRQRQTAAGGSRAAYLRYLAGVRAEVRTAADEQRTAELGRHPPPAALPGLAAAGLLRVRDEDDPAYLRVRLGVAPGVLTLDLLGPGEEAMEAADPAAAGAVRRFLSTYADVPDLPRLLDLREQRRIVVHGRPEARRAVARALLCSVAAQHSAETLTIAALADPCELPHWDWLKWLPHAGSRRLADAVGPARLVASSPAELEALLPRPEAMAQHHHLLVVVDGSTGRHPWRSTDHVTVLELGAPSDGATPLEAGGLLLEADEDADLDRCDLPTAEAFARRLPRTGSGGRSQRGDLPSLLGIADLAGLEPAECWRRLPGDERLRVPMGVDADGEAVHLDLKESAHGGAGPHGLLVGATGSGKSELLRTLVLGLALTHAPDDLNVVLVDFKGGATFAEMADLPHVSALITNLEHELTLVDRMQDALTGELLRRQELLRAAGNVASRDDYERERTAGRPLGPLPSLLVVVDEFSELLTARPEFIDLFVAIGRLGRSLGIHLLLASQRLDEGRLRGLESHLSYRIALRTFSAHESRAVLGLPDAYELPATPGAGYLRCGPDDPVRFQAAYSSGRLPAAPAPTTARTLLPFTVSRVTGAPVGPSMSTPAAAEATSLAQAVVRRLAGHGAPAHEIWLPPLDVPDSVEALMPDLSVDAALGLVSRRWRDAGPLRLPVGAVDRPRDQRRDVLEVDLSGAAGHVAVVGGPRSGKSSLIRTLVTSLALTTTPVETQVYVLDLGGGLSPLGRLPHVAGLAARSEPDVVRRIVAEVGGILDRREAWFRSHQIDSVESYRAGAASDGYGEVFLVVDGWGTLRADFEELEQPVHQLAARGLGLGVHVVASAARWSDFRPAVRDLLGTRLELRLGDAMDSEVDRRAAQSVPPRPGRGLLPGPLHFLAALADDALIDRVARAWRGPAGPKLRLLPSSVDLATLPPAGAGRVVLGIDERDLRPVALDLATEPHLLVLGDARSGKTSLLRSYCRQLVAANTPDQAQVLLVDHRRSLLGEVPASHLLGHTSSAAQSEQALTDLAAYLRERLPGPHVTPAQLRARSWWQGAEVYVVVDDHDLVATGTVSGSSLGALQPLLAQAGDVGLHLVVARRCGGAARAMFEPTLQALRDLAQPTVLLSGDPAEGPLVGGVAPVPSPPGRARLVTRERGAEVLQLAWTEPGR